MPSYILYHFRKLLEKNIFIAYPKASIQGNYYHSQLFLLKCKHLWHYYIFPIFEFERKKNININIKIVVKLMNYKYCVMKISKIVRILNINFKKHSNEQLQSIHL